MATGAGKNYNKSLEDLRSALDASGVVGLWDWDIVRRTAQYDRGAADLLALDPELAGIPLTKESAMAGIHPEDRDWLRAELRHALQAGGLFVAEYRVVTLTRGPRWLLSRGRVYHNSFARPVRAKGIIIDITETRDDAQGYVARTGARNPDSLDRAAASLLEARTAIDEAGDTVENHLRVVLDVALFEVGVHLARRARH